jgi:TPR repeat protein
MLSQGRGGARDTRAAIRWFEQAGLAGVTEAQMALAEIYSAGSGGVPADSVEAWAWLSRAADAGNVEAADLLTTLERRMDEAERAEATKLKQAHDALARMRRGG